MARLQRAQVLLVSGSRRSRLTARHICTGPGYINCGGMRGLDLFSPPSRRNPHSDIVTARQTYSQRIGDFVSIGARVRSELHQLPVSGRRIVRRVRTRVGSSVGQAARARRAGIYYDSAAKVIYPRYLRSLPSESDLISRSTLSLLCTRVRPRLVFSPLCCLADTCRRRRRHRYGDRTAERKHAARRAGNRPRCAEEGE